jgi:hypothetical protein
MSNSPPRTITVEDNPLVAVGIAADVPRNTILISTNFLECHICLQ